MGSRRLGSRGLSREIDIFLGWLDLKIGLWAKWENLQDFCPFLTARV